MVNKSNILMTARTFRYGGFCLVLWPISGRYLMMMMWGFMSSDVGLTY